ncbi:MAG: V4R domain-containing protein [Candidatus Hydrothermarchaeales archaeon]
MAEQAFMVDLGKEIDLEEASKKIDYISPPRRVGLFKAADATFDGTIVRLFENGWVRVVVKTELSALTEAMFKATESLVYIRKVVTDLRIGLGLDLDSDRVMASIKPVTEKFDLHEILIMDIDSIRPTFKAVMNPLFFRILHLYTLEEYVGATTAVKILYSTGEDIGKVFAGIYATDTLESFMEELKKFLEKERVAKISVQSMDESKIVIKSEESMTSAGIPTINKPVCHFERGFITGAIKEYLGKNINSRETKCWGLGDLYCEFVLEIEG